MATLKDCTHVIFLLTLILYNIQFIYIYIYIIVLYNDICFICANSGIVLCLFLTVYILYHIVRVRLRAVKNIQKITKSMKMIAAVKYNKAERELRLVRPFGVGAQSMLLSGRVYSFNIILVPFNQVLNYIIIRLL